MAAQNIEYPFKKNTTKLGLQNVQGYLILYIYILHISLYVCKDHSTDFAILP